MGFNQQYNVPKTSQLELLPDSKAIAISALYGIGIGRSIVKANTQRDTNTEFEVMGSNSFTPDAVQNGAGGYDATDRWDGKMSSSLIGMPVMCYFKFIGGDYFDYKGNIITVPDVTFETVLITLVQNKLIKKTFISGSDRGSIKEMLGDGDWDIEIRAIITADAPVNENIERKNQDGVYPRDNMSEIYKVLKAPVSIPIECWYLNMFDINYVMIEPGTVIQQVEGEYGVQRIIIPCSSDKPLIIRIDS